MEKILAINPGSTSTKIAVYDGEEQVLVKGIMHKAEDLDRLGGTFDQLDYRIEAISRTLKENGIADDSFDVVMGRGGGFPNLKTGGYLVNEALLDTAKNRPLFDHASNIGAALAHGFAKKSGCNAYIYDAVSADALAPIAKITGFNKMERFSLCHVLNARAMAIKYAKTKGCAYSDLNLIVAHMGGGITVSAHKKGVMTDIVRDDEGPMSPTRCGLVNATMLVEACYSGEFTKDEMIKKVRGDAGFVNLLGTNSAIDVQNMIEGGNQYAKLVMDATAYQVAKSCLSLLGAFGGEKVDALILTGGVAHSAILTSAIRSIVETYLPVILMPGESEMEALAYGGLRILRGEEEAVCDYK